jgi:FixJ family two-component response regulator
LKEEDMEIGDEDFGATPRGQLRVAAQSKIERLTCREREVLKLIAAGGANKTIARALGISPRTVEIHRSNMMRKLGTSAVADVVRIAIQGGQSED